jgi:hypothetical protein
MKMSALVLDQRASVPPRRCDSRSPQPAAVDRRGWRGFAVEALESAPGGAVLALLAVAGMILRLVQFAAAA